MTYDELIKSMTPEIHASLLRAIELGKWPNGQKLTDEQRDTCFRAIITYEQTHLPENQRTGYIDRTRPDGKQHGSDPLQPDILKILN